MQRLFIGLELPQIILQQLLALREDIPGARWQSAQQLHLTLCFIGNADDEMTRRLCTRMETLETPDFSLELRGADCFGPLRKPKAIWVAAQPQSPLLELHEEVEGHLSDVGLARENRPYQPHVTLARFSRNSPELAPGTVAGFLQRYGHYRSPPLRVTHASLFRSTPGSAGSHYEVLQRFDLASSAGPGHELVH